MLCQNCHQNPATIHLTTNINGRQTSLDLCQNCYRALKNQVSESGNGMGDPFGFDFNNLFSSMAGAAPNGQRQREQVPPTQGERGGQNNNGSILDQFGIDLTTEARAGRIDPVIGRDKEIKRVIEILNRRTKNNPVLIGEAGVGKTAVVEGLAQKIVDGDVPQKLLNKKVIRLDVVSLVQGTGIRGQFEQRMQELMQELKKAENIILFIDEIHEIVGAGNAEGGMDAGNVLKPALARGELQLVGATTLNEYRSIEKDAAVDDSNVPTVTEKDMEKIVEEKTNIPVGELKAKEKEQLKNLAQSLESHVIGQDEAVDKVARAIRRNRIGFNKSGRPIGSFLFVGPTGVGKTETAKQLARELFGTEDAMIRFDMSEYMEKHSVSKLIGSPPGYVGYEEAGQLTEQVRRHPYSLILLDEVEKAHPDVMHMFLQILDDGRLTDSQGRTVSFKDTIIIMTSNAGSGDSVVNVGFGADSAGKSNSIMDRLTNYFKPEFLNRFDDIVEFNALSKDDLMKIVNLMLDDVNQMLAQQGLTIHVTAPVANKLVELGYDPKMGARPLRRVIQEQIEDRIADYYLDHPDVKHFTAKLENDEIHITKNEDKEA